MRAATARDSAHVLDAAGLKAPAIRFWSLWRDDAVIGIGALKRLAADHGEVKSMHTAADIRRAGAGSTMLLHIVDAARKAGMKRLSLETGVQDYFAPSRALYARHGFRECGPFSDYRLDPNTVFMTLAL